MKNENIVSVIRQFEVIWTSKLVGLFGAIKGGIIPFAMFCLAHGETIKTDKRLWILVFAGLAFSGKTVYEITYRAASGTELSRKMKAWGFTILLEGTMSFTNEKKLIIPMLVLLILFNALEEAYNMVSRHHEYLKTEENKIAEAVNSALAIQAAKFAEQVEAEQKMLADRRMAIAAKRAETKARKLESLPAKKRVTKKQAIATASDDSLIEQSEIDMSVNEAMAV